jgi:hypothetical protein
MNPNYPQERAKMTSDAKLIRDIELRLQDLNLDEEETLKQRKIMYKAMKLEISGFISKDLELPEGSILVGVTKGELKQAIARDGLLWVDGEGCTALSTAAAKATGRTTQSGWEFFSLVYLPGSGFTELDQLRLTAPRVNGKRK